ncbi:MAG: PIG-L deacetylase family protein [Patescibacteria group bacterium]
MNVLGIGAHPDDLELMAGGTLRKYVEQGAAVTMSYLTNGDMGHAVIQPGELAGIRKAEAKAATEVIGAGFEWLGISDEWLFADEPTRRKVVDLIRKAQPDVILTHAPNDYHPDHRNAHHLVFDASFLATVPHIGGDYPTLGKVPEIYCLDTLGGLETEPTHYVDITPVYETKVEALRRHASQLQWMLDHDGIDFVDWMRIMAEFRGLQSGCRYAEAFTLVRRWPAVSTKRVLP